jgi:hypothetical protein
VVFIKAIGCYIVAFFALVALSVFFMGGAFVSYAPLAAIVVAVVIHRAIFKVRYMREVD